MRMRRILLIAAATACALVIGARPASAGYWSWLEEFSGPGPLKGWTVLSTFCVQSLPGATPDDKPRSGIRPSPIARSDAFHQRLLDYARNNRATLNLKEATLYKRLLANPGPAESLSLLNALQGTLTIEQQQGVPPALASSTALAQIYRSDAAEAGAGHKDKTMVCGYFDYGRFHSEVAVGTVDARGFPNVTANLYDVGPSVRLHDGLDIGGGFGRISFTARPPMQPELSRARWTITPFRSVIRPLLLAVPEQHRKDWMGVFSLYWKETYIAGKLTGADFGAPRDSYAVDGELVRSFGIIIDASALLPLVRR
jgi:hypothetical protein